MRVLAIATLLVAGLVAGARADTLADFEAARLAYEEQRYDDAAARLERLVAETAADAVSAAIVLESRKYLAASYLFLGRPTDAQQQFVLLLRQEPEYELDPVRFPRDVITTFEAARRQVDAEREEAARLAEEAAREAERRRAAEERLRQLEGQETVVVRNSRLLALMPFGVGQFRNGDRRLGRALAITESLLAASMISTYLVHFAYSYEDNPRDVALYNRRNDRVDIANWVSTGAFGVVAIVGIVEAQVNFRPQLTSTRPRATETPTTPAPTARFGIGFGRMDLRVTF